MIRGLFIAFISVVLSAATCIGIMMRYAHVSPSHVFQSGNRPAAVTRPGPRVPVAQIVAAPVVKPRPPIVHRDATQSQNPGPAKTDQTPGHFDYQKLSADLEAVSQALLQLNQLLSSEINRIKSKSAQTAASAQAESAS